VKVARRPSVSCGRCRRTNGRKRFDVTKPKTEPKGRPGQWQLPLELGRHDVDDGDVRSRVAAIVSWLKAAAMGIIHDGIVWELATVG
jgi:hypothetical protein